MSLSERILKSVDIRFSYECMSLEFTFFMDQDSAGPCGSLYRISWLMWLCRNAIYKYVSVCERLWIMAASIIMCWLAIVNTAALFNASCETEIISLETTQFYFTLFLFHHVRCTCAIRYDKKNRTWSPSTPFTWNFLRLKYWTKNMSSYFFILCANYLRINQLFFLYKIA